MNNEEKKSGLNFEKTGYKAVDAIVYVIIFIYEANRKNMRVFILSVLMLAFILMTYLYVDAIGQLNAEYKKGYEAGRKDGKEEMLYLKNEVKNLTVALQEAQLYINNFYEKLIKSQEQKEKK